MSVDRTITFRPPADSHPLDWPKIAAHLRQAGFLLDLSVQPRQFGGGLANLNYLLRVDNGWAVLRRPPSGPLPPGAHDMVREHRILARLWRALPLAPRSLHLCEDRDVAGAPFQLLEYRSGTAVRGDRVAPLADTAATGLALSRMLIETLASIHDVDMEAVGLDTLGRPADFFRRTCRGWARRAELVLETGAAADAGMVSQWLAQQQDVSTMSPTLLHSDFKLDNILLDPTTGQPAAVLDWDMGTRGNPLLDLATLLSYWTEPGDPPCMHRLAQMPTARPGFLTREEVASRYGALTGRSLTGLKPYRVLAVFKLGVVFHQLAELHGHDAATADAGYAQLGHELLEFCRDIISDKLF